MVTNLNRLPLNENLKLINKSQLEWLNSGEMVTLAKSVISSYKVHDQTIQDPPYL